MEQTSFDSTDATEVSQCAEKETGHDDTKSYYKIATHRCHGVVNWELSFCDVDLVSWGGTVTDSEGNEIPPAYDSFKCHLAKCQVCLDLNREFYHHDTCTMLRSVTESAAKGCFTCGILQEGIRKWSNSVSVNPSPFTMVKIDLQDGPVSLQLSGPVESWEAYENGGFNTKLQFYCSEGMNAVNLRC
jgi:hypothetical protein